MKENNIIPKDLKCYFIQSKCYFILNYMKRFRVPNKIVNGAGASGCLMIAPVPFLDCLAGILNQCYFTKVMQFI